jgi:hypothetical protein
MNDSELSTRAVVVLKSILHTLLCTGSNRLWTSRLEGRSGDIGSSCKEADVIVCMMRFCCISGVVSPAGDHTNPLHAS